MPSAGLAHLVYFSLTDNSAGKTDELIAACKKYLDDHPGVTYFSVGRLNPDLSRPVNDRDYEVALHVVFTDRASHDAYQIAPRHSEFIEEQKSNWKRVRVFDSDLA
ncbi:MAG: Dabb family protein [Pirellulaceae bacterium]|nr:Dabb family protein [Pirellulaceae bacterium]